MHEPRYDVATVRREARDQWDIILSHLAPEIEEAIHRPGKHIPCPVHGGKDGFRVFKDVRETGGGICNTCGSQSDGFALLMWLRNWDFVTTLKAVAELLGTGALTEFTYRRAPAPTKAPERMHVAKRLSDTWKQSIPITDAQASVARRYFESRGVPVDGWLHLIPDHESVIRFHPGLTYYQEGELEGRFPAIVCLVVDKNGSAVNLHRTYLDPHGTGKAAVSSPKKLMTPLPGKTTSGAAIRLGPIDKGLVQGAEGLETAAAIMTARQKPVWCLISDTMMSSFDPPDEVHNIVLWADNDHLQIIHGKETRPGLDCAQKAAIRFHEQGRKARILVPQYPIPDGCKSVDWLDVFNQYGPQSVGPSQSVVQLPQNARPPEEGIFSKIASIWRVV